MQNNQKKPQLRGTFLVPMIVSLRGVFKYITFSKIRARIPLMILLWEYAHSWSLEYAIHKSDSHPNTAFSFKRISTGSVLRFLLAKSN